MLAVGDHVVEPEDNSLAEVVTVEAVRVVIFSEIDDYQLRFTATLGRCTAAADLLRRRP